MPNCQHSIIGYITFNLSVEELLLEAQLTLYNLSRTNKNVIHHLAKSAFKFYQSLFP